MFNCSHLHAFIPIQDDSNAIRSVIAQIEEQVGVLPSKQLQISPWTLGYRSNPDISADEPVTLDVLFDEAAIIDLVVLFPALYTPDGYDPHSFGFPEHFTIEGILADETRVLLVDYSKQRYPKPGLGPQLFDIDVDTLLAGLRITSLQHPATPKEWRKGQRVVAFSELMAFSGPHNVALQRKVKASTTQKFESRWHHTYLIDGFSHYAPVDGQMMEPYRNVLRRLGNKTLILEMDLGKPVIADELRLWPATPAIEEMYSKDIGTGFPMQVKVEGAIRADFFDAETLYQSQRNTPLPAAGPKMLRLRKDLYKPLEKVRYLRFHLSDGYRPGNIARPQIALTEIEVFSRGRLLTGDLFFTYNVDNKLYKTKGLTDGTISSGKIVPLRQWIEDYEKRTQLQKQLSMLRIALEDAIRSERQLFARYISVALVLIILLGLTIIIIRLLGERRWKRKREQIASDLHDELGGKMSSVAHSAELLQLGLGQIDEANKELLDHTVRTAVSAAEETRRIVRLLEERASATSLSQQIREAADEVLAEIPHTCTLDGLEKIKHLQPTRQLDFILFIREALNNALRHADATHVLIKTHTSGRRITVEIEDDGKGIPKNKVPLRHLEKRARRIRGKMYVRTAKEAGTRVSLSLKLRPRVRLP
ncbi:MAG: ATP-binding protein [Verrucomicrobiota bacterium]